MIKKIIKNFILLSGLIMGLCPVNAQETIPAAGGNASGSGGSMSFTAGQAGYITHTSTTGSVAQGVQQALVVTVVNAVDNTEDIALELSAYPNPVTDLLILKTGDTVTSAFAYQLFDLSGRLRQHDRVKENTAIINMGSLPPATYLLKVIRNNATVKTFQIIKN